MFTADFGYKQLKKWIKRPHRRIAVLCKDTDLVRNLLLNEIDKCLYNRETNEITLRNHTTIQFYKVKYIGSPNIKHEIYDPQWHYLWGHQVPHQLAELAQVGVRLGSFPTVLFTE